jgi:hypothetical protein
VVPEAQDAIAAVGQPSSASGVLVLGLHVLAAVELDDEARFGAGEVRDVWTDGMLAADAFAFDLRWKYAAGALDFDHPGFVHTVLVDMRERLRRSERPNRIFEVVLAVAKEAGLVGRKRVLDSTALYDAVATQDTVTLIRHAPWAPPLPNPPPALRAGTGSRNPRSTPAT